MSPLLQILLSFSLFWVHEWNFGDQTLIVWYTMQYLSFLCHKFIYFSFKIKTGVVVNFMLTMHLSAYSLLLALVRLVQTSHLSVFCLLPDVKD